MQHVIFSTGLSAMGLWTLLCPIFPLHIMLWYLFILLASSLGWVSLKTVYVRLWSANQIGRKCFLGLSASPACWSALLPLSLGRARALPDRKLASGPSHTGKPLPDPTQTDTYPPQPPLPPPPHPLFSAHNSALHPLFSLAWQLLTHHTSLLR